MRMNLSVDEIETLIRICLTHDYQSVSSCEIGLKLITHLPLELQKDYKTTKAIFNEELIDLEAKEYSDRAEAHFAKDW
jgi:hypothetical protein